MMYNSLSQSSVEAHKGALLLNKRMDSTSDLRQ